MPKVLISSRTLPYKLLLRMNDRLSSYVRKIKTALKINTEYRYTNFSIILPADHLLPTYRLRHKQYDRFLPHLSKYLDPAATVIDVGANCGDTLAAMYDANKKLNYICIEPDETFFRFLQKNLLRIKAIDASASIQAIKALAGSHSTGVSLEGTGGTKKAIFDSNNKSISAESLDRILSSDKTANIRLLKSDVDGFDYDVIDSAESILNSHSPILFFECHFDHAYQKVGFKKTIASLKSRGYAQWVIFDNFGEVMLRTNDIQQIGQLLDYVWRQNMERTTRTIYYYDILAATIEDRELIDKVIDDYISSD